MGCRGCKKVKKPRKVEKVVVVSRGVGKSREELSRLVLCPECGNQLRLAGCWFCPNCGWEKCA